MHRNASGYPAIVTLLVISLLAGGFLYGVMIISLRQTPCSTLSMTLDTRRAQWQQAHELATQSPWLKTVTQWSQPLIDVTHEVSRVFNHNTVQQQRHMPLWMKKALPDSMTATARCFTTLAVQHSQYWWQKWQLVIAMLPWCVIMIGAGVVEGKVHHYIRKCELGRESSYAFHTVTKRLWQMGLLSWWGYWLIGNATTAQVFLCGFLGLVALTHYQRCARFKKYR